MLDDADFEQAVDLTLRGVFINLGQNCLAAERIYVQRPLFERFRAAVVERARALRVGVPAAGNCDCGALGMAAQLRIVEALIADALAAGATLEVGGCRLPAAEGADGSETLFFAPTVLSGVTHAMRIANEEAFGPVLLLMAFDSDAQVVQMANCTPYGLGCTIVSKNYERAEAIGRQIESGMCCINDFGLSYLIQSLPFGGCKVSGFGRFNGPEGLREFSRQRSVVSDRWRVRTKVPKFAQYPVPANGPAIIREAVTAIYASSVWTRLQAVRRLLAQLMH